MRARPYYYIAAYGWLAPDLYNKAGNRRSSQLEPFDCMPGALPPGTAFDLFRGQTFPKPFEELDGDSIWAGCFCVFHALEDVVELVTGDVGCVDIGCVVEDFSCALV